MSAKTTKTAAAPAVAEPKPLRERSYSDGSKFGYYERRNRTTGTTIIIGHGFDVGLDYETDGPWYSICETHGFLCSHKTLRLASSFAGSPEDWCDECRTIFDERKAASK